MISRLASLLLTATLVAPVAAQTVRFQTTVGTFDMLLNPTNNAELQPLVDNMLANVAGGIYQNNIVNRAPEDFVLQLGSFRIDPNDISNLSANVFDSNEGFDPVIVDTDGDLNPDIDLGGLSNVRGTVSLALSGGNPNTGSASFFVNLADNSFLNDQGFVPFAAIVDMTDIDRITSLDQVDLAPGTNLAFDDVPVDENGNLVIVETASVISESNFSFVGPLQNALGIDPSEPTPSASSLVATPESLASLLPETALLSADPALSVVGGTSAMAVPEPSSLLLALAGLAGLRRRCR